MSKKSPPPTLPDTLEDKLDRLTRYLDRLAREHPTLEAIAAKNLAEQIRRDSKGKNG